MLRWIHKSWKIFWEALLSLLLIVIILAGGTVGLLQLNVTKGIIAEKIENTFSQNHYGQLNIGKLRGFLPFTIKLDNVSLTSQTHNRPEHAVDTLITIKKARIGVDVWAFFRGKLNINAFHLHKPSVRLLANGSGGYTLTHALMKKDTTSSSGSHSSGSMKTGIPLLNIELTAPAVIINDGSLYAERHQHTGSLKLPDPLSISDIDTKMFIQSTGDQRFVDIDHFTAHVHHMKAGHISLSGQVYNNNQVLEFNGFELAAGHSHVHLNGKIKGVDVDKGALRKQLANAVYDVSIYSNRLQLSEFDDIMPRIPDIHEPLNFSVQTGGTLSALRLDNFKLGMGKSYFSIAGKVDHLFKENQLAYNFHIDTLAIREQDLKVIDDSLTPKQYRALKDLHLNGRAKGTSDSLIVDLSGSSSLGAFTLEGSKQLKKPYRYQGMLSGKGIDIGPLTGAKIDTTSLNFRAHITGQNTSLKKGRMSFTGSAYNSFINHFHISNIHLLVALNQGVMKTTYYYQNEQQSIKGRGKANFSGKAPSINVQGDVQNLNIADFLSYIPVDSTRLNGNYTFAIKGTDLDQVHGMARLRVNKSMINGDSVRAHYIKIQLAPPNRASRTLQVNSSLFNLSLSGNLKPSNLLHQMAYWDGYFKQRMAKEIRLDSTLSVPNTFAQNVQPLQLTGQFKAGDLTLINRYWPAFPKIRSNATAHFTLKADSSILQFSSHMASDTLDINNTQVRGVNGRMSGRFNHHQTLKDSGRFDFETNAGRIETSAIKMDSVTMNLHYRQDSVYYAQQVKRFSKRSHFNLQMDAVLSDSSIKVGIDKFFLGNNKYAWQTTGNPQLIYDRSHKVTFHSFRFQNGKGYLALKGALSPNPHDSLRTIIHNVNLARVSDLLKGRLNFSGRLNGELQTRSLTYKPAVQGHLTADGLKLQDRLVGDVSFLSFFNQKAHRFDTKLTILTDTTKYQKYLEKNNGIGQDIVLKGYVKPSNWGKSNKPAFHFDANFKDVDLWVLHPLVPNIFKDIEGRAKGSGSISGNMNNLDFDTNFDIHNVYVRPNFLNTNYYLTGHIAFSSKNGVVLDHVDVKDKYGGTGLLTGTVDMNHFKPEKIFDIRMTLNNLKFLNTDYAPDTPFFGNLTVTGKLRLSGTSNNMKLRSPQTIHIAGNSMLGIPLANQNGLNPNNNFIRFVNSFKHLQKKASKPAAESTQNSNTPYQPDQHLTFSERMDLDLHFTTSDPINVRIIFDEVTNEHLSAQGTGRMRITMESGNMRLFGHFNVDGGDYQFVRGEIFSRKLDISPGGSIVWEGPPDNGRLNIHAVYHARPSLSSLYSTSDNLGEQTPQRVPVDLVVHITGPMQHLQKQYQFEIPNNFNLTSNSTLQYTLQSINTNQQQKLLQATSILLTGNFLAIGPSSSTTGQLGGEFGRSSTFINPLLSNQIISPLVSNQINSLINSNAVNFDFNFRFNQYNQIDLGVALRLYNNKVILRREGYLTGGRTQSTQTQRIGDLSATYRINRHLSLNAFHRQDNIFGNIPTGARANDILPTTDGLGIKTQVQFNTWQQLAHKVQNFFRGMFGKDKINYKKQARKEKKTTHP